MNICWQGIKAMMCVVCLHLTIFYVPPPPQLTFLCESRVPKRHCALQWMLVIPVGIICAMFDYLQRFCVEMCW